MNIAVLFGGISTERNVSLVGGKAVIDALRRKGHNVIPIDPAFGNDIERKAEALLTTDLDKNISKFNTIEELSVFNPRSYIECVNSDLFDDIDCAFIVLHGKYGEDGTIQSLLDLREIKYTGSNPKSSAIAMDKAMSKNIFVANRLLTPHWELLAREDADDDEVLKYIMKLFGKNIVVKPSDQGSTIGLSIIDDGYTDTFANAIKYAGNYSNNILIEKYIEGRELTVAIIDGEALPIVEIITEDGFYDYEHKYIKGKTNYICPDDIPNDIVDFTQSVATAAYNSLGCSCFGRVDFILDAEGQPYLLEVNTIPGFSTSSLVPKAAQEIGLDFDNLCEKLVSIALGNV
ncbi:MAG: D-alanine--D-alanine ligase [Bacteroidetes bacterium]|nr:D-alanine--D-alanine ligase [Bacteroidota bacterium]